MTDRIDENPPMSIPEQAAEWLLRWHCGDLSIAERFEYLTWLKTSPVHIAETLRMCRLYSWLQNTKLNLFVTNEDTFSNVVELPPREREAIKARSASRTALWKVRIAAGSGGHWPHRSARRSARRFSGSITRCRRKPASGAACRSVTAALSAPHRTREFITTIGDDQRLITLARGSAVFRVAKDPSRPFLVDAGHCCRQSDGHGVWR